MAQGENFEVGDIVYFCRTILVHPEQPPFGVQGVVIKIEIPSRNIAVKYPNWKNPYKEAVNGVGTWTTTPEAITKDKSYLDRILIEEEERRIEKIKERLACLEDKKAEIDREIKELEEQLPGNKAIVCDGIRKLDIED